MTIEEACKILYRAWSAPHSVPFDTLDPVCRAPWNSMATALLEAVEAELQSQHPCPHCGCGISAKCYGCLAAEWRARAEALARALGKVDVFFRADGDRTFDHSGFMNATALARRRRPRCDAEGDTMKRIKPEALILSARQELDAAAKIIEVLAPLSDRGQAAVLEEAMRRLEWERVQKWKRDGR